MGMASLLINYDKRVHPVWKSPEFLTFALFFCFVLLLFFDLLFCFLLFIFFLKNMFYQNLLFNF